jgi:hypothetical protein
MLFLLVVSLHVDSTVNIVKVRFFKIKIRQRQT